MRSFAVTVLVGIGLLGLGPAASGENCPYGINAHVPDSARLAKVREAGLGWIRIDMNWFQIETSNGHFNWGAIDNAVSAADTYGLYIFATLAYTPGWANGGQHHSYPPSNPNDWTDFVQTAVNRYRNSIQHWGMWNEPNLDGFWKGSRSQYINDILINGANAVRAVDSSAKVCGPELAHLSSGDWDDWLQDCIAQASGHIDILTHHCYGDSHGEVTDKLEDDPVWPWDPPSVKQVLQDAGWWGRPVWLTETGWQSADVGEGNQANYYTGLLNDWFTGNPSRSWIDKVFFYELSDSTAWPDLSWGILGPDPGYPRKQAFYAYRDFITAHPADCTREPAGELISNLNRYEVAIFTNGTQYYSDRSYTISSIPSHLNGAEGIRTENDDKDETSETWITFDLARAAEVYIAYDQRATSLPNWMSGYANTGDTIGTTDPNTNLKLYKKFFAGGPVVLGANNAPGAANSGSNYIVLVVPVPLITNLNRYEVATLNVGSEYYVDRTYTITSMPSNLRGQEGIKTANDDKYQTSETWITFNLAMASDIYIAFTDDATSLPNWMSGYDPVGSVIGVTDPVGILNLYMRTYPAGGVVLGANSAAGAANANSHYIVLAVANPGAAVPPAITQHPQSQSVCAGDPVTFSVTATGSTPLSYQWRKNGSGIGGATYASYTIDPVTAGHAGSYDCVVSNGYGNATSNAATLTVKAATAITQHPENQEVEAGATAQFTVAATGAGTLTYQWQKNGSDLSDGGNISGATAATLEIADASGADEAGYRCVVTGDCGSAPSNEATLTVTLATVAPDFDRDGDVDQEDLVSFEACASGPAIPWAPDCQDRDFDTDGDVDQEDFALFQVCISGPDILADPGCLD